MYDVLIIGAGPAGMTAGIYASRGGLSVAIIEKFAIGGQASTTPEVENYSGIPKISGFDLCLQMMNQCQTFGVKFFFDTITEYSLLGEEKYIILSSGEKIIAKTAIIATGATPRKLGLPNEDKLIGSGISYCATCDGGFFKQKTVAVVGGGNTAVEDALYLQTFAKEVYLIHRRDALRADFALTKRLEKSKVKVIWDSVVEKLIEDTKLTEIEVKNVKTNTLTSVLVNGVFVAVGQIPQIDALDFVEKTASGYIKADENMKTNIDGVFVCGDVREKNFRQIITACSDGAIAGDSAIKYIHS